MQNQNENFTFEGFKKENNKFIPTTSLHNHHRHFGTYTNQKIYFDLEELLYLNNMPELKDYKLYSLFKNNNYNLRKKNDFLKEYFIFDKHKHFNRKKDLPIGICKDVGKENCFIKEIEDCDGLFWVLRIESEDSCCLKVEFVSELDKNLEIKDYKN